MVCWDLVWSGRNGRLLHGYGALLAAVVYKQNDKCGNEFLLRFHGIFGVIRSKTITRCLCLHGISTAQLRFLMVNRRDINTYRQLYSWKDGLLRLQKTTRCLPLEYPLLFMTLHPQDASKNFKTSSCSSPVQLLYLHFKVTYGSQSPSCTTAMSNTSALARPFVCPPIKSLSCLKLPGSTNPTTSHSSPSTSCDSTCST